MTESEFWSTLEYRVTSELAGKADRAFERLWCDGFVPWDAVDYRLNDPEPRIDGVAWICDGPEQELWRFTFFLPHAFESLDKVDWESVMPPKNVTRWLAVDRERKYLEIEPGAAVPDLK